MGRTSLSNTWKSGRRGRSKSTGSSSNSSSSNTPSRSCNIVYFSAVVFWIASVLGVCRNIYTSTQMKISVDVLSAIYPDNMETIAAKLATTTTTHNAVFETTDTTVTTANTTSTSLQDSTTTNAASMSIANYTPYTFIDDDLVVWRKRRARKDIYNSWFQNGTDHLKDNADEYQPHQHDHGQEQQKQNENYSDFPILDFVIAGFPKCGTTALMRNLAAATTMPSETDVCTPPSNTVYYAYHSWASKYGPSHRKLLKGNKCPAYLDTGYIPEFVAKLPRTRLIVGIRHPVLWFQSFHIMQEFRFSQKNSHLTTREYFSKKVLPKCSRQAGCDLNKCIGHNNKVCVARARFHLSLAMLGKTPLSKDEQDLLLSEVKQSKKRLHDNSKSVLQFQLIGKPNPVFLFDSSQPKEEYFWQELSEFLRINRTDLPMEGATAGYKTLGMGLNKNEHIRTMMLRKDTIFDICDPKHDFLRQELMPVSYTLHQWLTTYFLPVARDPNRKDVVIPNVDEFERIIETFKYDPCTNSSYSINGKSDGESSGRNHGLVRNETDGEYYPAREDLR